MEVSGRGLIESSTSALIWRNSEKPHKLQSSVVCKTTLYDHHIFYSTANRSICVTLLSTHETESQNVMI
jgi:hypothetical protein